MFNQLTLLSRGVNDLLLADLIVWNVVFWENYDWGRGGGRLTLASMLIHPEYFYYRAVLICRCKAPKSN